MEVLLNVDGTIAYHLRQFVSDIPITDHYGCTSFLKLNATIFIKKLIDLGCTIKWFTTWEDDANIINKLINIEPFKIIKIDFTNLSDGSYKIDTLDKLIQENPDVKRIVIDDSIDKSFENTIIFKPSGNTLTTDDMRNIIDLVQKERGE